MMMASSRGLAWSLVLLSVFSLYAVHAQEGSIAEFFEEGKVKVGPDGFAGAVCSSAWPQNTTAAALRGWERGGKVLFVLGGEQGCVWCRKCWQKVLS